MTDPRGTLCVIPARGGSRRVPRKNVRLIDGTPLISLTLERVIASDVADRVIVSTDDDEIAAIAEEAGADVPFRRPAHLADDHTPTAPVIEHALSVLGESETYSHVLVVYPTAVLLDGEDLRRARDAVVGAGHELAMSACRYSSPVERAWTVNSDGTGRMRHPEHALTRTQDLPVSYFDAGQFYFGSAGFWRRGGDVAGSRPFLVELPVARAIDIDTEEDLAFADLVVKAARIAR